METLSWWGLGLGVFVVVGLLIAAIIIQRINMTGLQAIIASQAETIDEVRGVADVMRNEAVASLNEAIARRKEAADRANVLEGKVRLLESELTGTVRRCDVEMARLRGVWEARIAELELERDQAWQQHDRAAAEWDKQKAIADALADQNKQLADAHDALAAENVRKIADLNATIARWRYDCEKYQQFYWQVRDAMAAERQRANEEAKAVQA